MFSAKAYTKGAELRLAKIEKRIKKQGKATINDLLQAGMEKARVLVPKGRGNLYRSIQGSLRETGEGPSARIFIDPYITPNRLSKGEYPNFSLVRWMHETGGRFKTENTWALILTKGMIGQPGTTPFKNGDPRFMYSTRNYLNSIKRNVATGRFKNINI